MSNIRNGVLASILDKELAPSIFNILDKKKTKQDRYLHLMRGINILSYSTFSGFHSCERKFQLKKLELSGDNNLEFVGAIQNNIHFAFGKAIESGIHAVLLGKPRHQIWFDMFRAWDADLLYVDEKYKDKSFLDAWIAIDKFSWIKDNMFQGWELAYFNGKPAIELSMCINMENGYYYLGHMDVALYNPIERRYRVLEIKTTGLKWVHPAMYKNSDQANGYTIILDSIAKDIEETATFEVFYLVFTTVDGMWKRFDFTYSRSNRAGWINTIMLDINRINTYRKVEFWPKRGGSCMDYGKPCQFYDVCDLNTTGFSESGEFEEITEEELEEHSFDFRFNISKIIATQQELI